MFAMLLNLLSYIYSTTQESELILLNALNRHDIVLFKPSINLRYMAASLRVQVLHAASIALL